MSPVGVVLDTNVFVAAGFRATSASAAIVEAVRDERLRMPWTDPVRREVASVLRSIPPLSWSDARALFREVDRIPDAPSEEGLGWIPDPSDRKFAALARSAGAVLVSSDGDLLYGRAGGDVRILTPGEFRSRVLR